mmetsp:Transcript_54254/g.118788  ORF Transcript_54254/g.118788 Transcript_54254/m.118788 type:complete len:333 (+) Transcript_54254:310-1308(+)
MVLTGSSHIGMANSYRRRWSCHHSFGLRCPAGRVQGCGDGGLLRLQVSPVAVVMERSKGGPISGHLMSLLRDGESLVDAAEVVEVGGVQGTFNHGLDGRRHLPERFEIQALEEGMHPDLLRRQAILGVTNEPLQQISSLFPNIWIGRHLKPPAPMHHPCRSHGWIMTFVTEGRTAKQHLEHDDPYGPHVALLAIGSFPIDLRPHIVRRSHHGLHLLAGRMSSAKARWTADRIGRHGRVTSSSGLRLLILAKAKIQQVNMAIDVKDDVVGLDVPMDVVQIGVDVVNGLNQLSDVEARFLLVKGVLPHEMRHQVAPGKVIHDHVEVRVILEGRV